MILALDISTTCIGFVFITENGVLKYFGKLKDCFIEEREFLYKEYRRFEQMVVLWRPTIVAAEDVFAGKNLDTFKTLSKLQSALDIITYKHKVPLVYIPVRTARAKFKLNFDKRKFVKEILPTLNLTSKVTKKNPTGELTKTKIQAEYRKYNKSLVVDFVNKTLGKKLFTYDDDDICDAYLIGAYVYVTKKGLEE